MFIRGKKLNISTVFNTQSYFAVPKNARLNCTHFFYYENYKQTRASAFNHLLDIDYKDFIIFTKNVLQNHIFSD